MIFEVSTAVKMAMMMTMFFWVLTTADPYIDTYLRIYTASITGRATSSGN
jgi:hypothetical protein